MTDAIKTTGTYTIPECNLEQLQSRIERLSKRAAKLGCSPITIDEKLLGGLTYEGEITVEIVKAPSDKAIRRAEMREQ